MKRRGFLASLFALPAAAKAMTEVKPATQGLPDMKAMGRQWYAMTGYGLAVDSYSIIDLGQPTHIQVSDRMK